MPRKLFHHIIADLYQARHLPLEQRFSTFLYGRRHVESVDVNPNTIGCSTSTYNECPTLPDYMETCNTTGEEHMIDFGFWIEDYQGGLSYMFWTENACDIDGRVIQTIPLIDGHRTGCVYDVGGDEPSINIAVRWYMICYEGDGDRCVENVQKDLRLVSLDEFVRKVKVADCD